MVKYLDEKDEESRGGETGGQGGKSGKIGVRVQVEISRDDLLAPSEIKRLTKTHQDIHKSRVDKQKLLRKEREALKEGRVDKVMQYRSQLGMGGGSGSMSRYKKHPITNKAQFSGIDKQVTSIPTENQAETNSEVRNDLENRLNHRFQPKRTFNPKPRPY